MSVLENFFAAKLFFRLIALKSVYQLTYLVFVLVVMKSLSVEDYGMYSYILSIILCFSTMPLLGFPLYLQRNMANQQAVHKQYVGVISLVVVIGFAIAFSTLPDALTIWLKLAIMLIITYNAATAILVAVNDGVGKYATQYQYLLLASLWMVMAILHYFLSAASLTISTLIGYWVINVAAVLILAVKELRHVCRQHLPIAHARPHSSLFIILDLVLMYALNIPDGFAKFYDRYLAYHYLDQHFLGDYSFNLMIVATMYAFFVRPANSLLISNLSKAQHQVMASGKIIAHYYLYLLLLYGSIYLVYSIGYKKLLFSLGLEQYLGTFYLFQVVCFNTLLYVFSYPFVVLLVISSRKHDKLCYCILSLLVFNLPLLLLNVAEVNRQLYLCGFMFAYLCHFILILCIEHTYAKAFFSYVALTISQFYKRSFAFVTRSV